MRNYQPTNLKPNTADKEGIKKIIKIVKQGESLLIFPEGDISVETFNYADVQIIIGKQFELIKRGKNQDKKDYEELSIKYIMNKIAELLPENYRGVYSNVYENKT